MSDKKHSHHKKHHDGHHHRKQEGFADQKALTIRMHSGLAGDMFVCGLIRMLGYSQEQFDEILNGILPNLKGTVELSRKSVNGIGGWYCKVSLPHEHEHRTLNDVLAIVNQAQLSEKAKELATNTFSTLAQAEAQVHSKSVEEVTFHEVGALDSILDICFTCELYVRLAPQHLFVSPLPIADGNIHCAHGVIPCPAPAVQAMLIGFPVRPFPVSGETVTPTAIALLKSLNPTFGGWPHFTVEKIDTVYGTYEYPDVPNGAVFAYGTLFK